MIIQNGVGITSLLNGNTVKEALNAANELVNRGIYNPTTLSAVDPDLAVGNIADGVTIFGKVGTLEATVTELLSVHGTTYVADWGGAGWNFQLKVSDTVPAAAVKVMLLLAASCEAADAGGKILYNGVERVSIAESIDPKMGCLCRWLGDGIGSNATVEYWPKGVSSEMAVWFAQCWYTS